ncbi:MAG: hypothetical protein HY901_21635 [Deltaproteobacteria bacterium]|nr:hypothetical protein [Deltaproteobacteria bacterium]
MSRVDQTCTTNPTVMFDDEQVSLPAQEPGANRASATPASQPADAPREEAGGDSLSVIDSMKAFVFGKDKAKTSPRFGPNNLPKPPAEPRHQTTPTNGLTGGALERAETHNEKVWGDYADAYQRYLDGYREAFKNCSKIEDLRQLQPDPPADTMAQVGHEAAFKKLDHEFREMFTDKVDRGYELLGKTPPGTLTFILGGALNVALGPFGFGAEGKAQVNSRGEANTKVVSTGSYKSGPVKGTIQSDGTQSLSVDAKGIRAKINSKGEGELRVGREIAGSAYFNPQEGYFGGGVHLGEKLEAGDNSVSVEFTAKAQFQGMSKEDVDRALRGWLAKPPEENVNEKWLKEHQLRAQVSR